MDQLEQDGKLVTDIINRDCTSMDHNVFNGTGFVKFI